MKEYIEIALNDLVMRGYENKRSRNECLVMFHGFTGNKMETSRMFLSIDQMLEKEDISSLRFDWFGHGESDLDFSSIDVDILLSQGRKILEYAKKRYQKVYLLGFSMGGALAINLLELEPDKLILISPAINMHEISSKAYELGKKLSNGLVDLRGFYLSKNFCDSLKKLEYKNNISRYKQPVLVIHGNKDLAVPIELSRGLVQSVEDCKFVEIDGADHGYSTYEFTNTINESIKHFL